MADRTHTRPKASELTLDEFLAAYPRMAGGDPEGDPKPDPTADPTPDPAPAPDPKPDPTPDDAPLGEAGERALKAEREARKAAEKAAREAQARVKEYEDAQKSDAEKAAERLEAAEKAAVEANRKLAAIEAGLPADVAERLRGNTPEELKADAEALKALLGTSEEKKDDTAGATPPGSLDGGSRSGAPKMDLAEVRRLAAENPRKLNELLDSGYIKLSELS